MFICQWKIMYYITLITEVRFMEYKAPKTEITGSTTDTPQGHRYATLQKQELYLWISYLEGLGSIGDGRKKNT